MCNKAANYIIAKVFNLYCQSFLKPRAIKIPAQATEVWWDALGDWETSSGPHWTGPEVKVKILTVAASV